MISILKALTHTSLCCEITSTELVYLFHSFAGTHSNYSRWDGQAELVFVHTNRVYQHKDDY